MEFSLFDYDDANVDSILKYTEGIVGEKFIDIIDKYQNSVYKSYDDFQTNTISEKDFKEISMKSKYNRVCVCFS